MFMNDYKTIKLEEKDHVGLVTLCNPPVNTITFELLDELSKGLDELESNENIWAVVICSSMKIFCAGADVKALSSCDRAGNIKTSVLFKDVFHKIDNFPHPVICAVNGAAFGGGFELALACDLRVFDRRAKAAFPEARLGLVPGAGGTQRLTRLIGSGRAKQLIFTAMTLTAEEAYRLGICEYLTGEGDATAFALNLANDICRNSPLAVLLDKKCINYVSNDNSLSDGLEYETYIGSDAFMTEDLREGISAFLEKRAPVFQNR